MEVGEKEGQKLQPQVPWLPTTPLKPILPKPVPIYTPGEVNQLASHVNGVFACFESSAGTEINSRPQLRSAPAAAASNTASDNARTRVMISFDNVSSSSNGLAELWAQADAPSAYSNARHDEILMNQFVPTSNSQFNQTDTLLGQSHISRELTLINTIHDNYQDPQGTSYFAYNSKTTSQVAPPTPDNTIRVESRQVAAMQMNVEERYQGVDQKTVPATERNNNETPQNKEPCDSVIEFAAFSTPCNKNHSHNMEISHDIDLNKTPRSKPRRRKHRPKVITEGKPKRTRKPVTPKPVQSEENPTGKRKYVRRKPTPQTEVTGEWTKSLMSESAKKTCRRSLNFDIGEQPRDENPASRENATHFGREVGMAVEETQALNNYKSLHEDTQAPNTDLSKSNPPVAKPNANSVENGSKRKGHMTAWDEHENRAKILSKSVQQSSPNDSNIRNRGILTTGLQIVGSKRKHSCTIQHADTSNGNLTGAQYNVVQVYYPGCWIQFPNVHKKRRSEKGKNCNTSNIFSATTTKDVQLATCPQDVRSQQNIRRSRVPTQIHDCASLTFIRNCDTKLTHIAQQLGSSDRQTFGEAERPQTCIDALIAAIHAPFTKKKRTKKRSTLVSSAYSSTNEMRQHHKFVLENHRQPLDNSLDVAHEEIWKNIHPADALTERFTRLNISREARELVLHEQNALVPYNQQNQKHKALVHGYGTIIPFDGSFNPIRKQRPRPKVDLDEETNRVWKLLMLDINSHGIDGTDEDKAKWWEQERNVFRGRADSFIARMHLVQGDRRFTQWKGSVVDSVIGVFLTQNVSDHLSSSAFMSLAARFPLKSNSKYKTYQEDSTSLIVNKPQVHIVEPEEYTTLDERILNQSVYELSSMTIEIIEHSGEKEAVNSNDSCRTTGSIISLTDESNCKLMESAQSDMREQHSPMESRPISAMTEEGQENSCHTDVRKELNDVVSSQCSVITSQTSGDFSVDPNPEKIGSSSDSNSEVEDFSCAAKHNISYDKISFRKLLEMASSTMLHDFNSQRSKSTENLRDAYGQYIDMKHDKLTENLEKSNVTQGSLEASIIPCGEHTLKMTPNSGVLEVNCFDPLKIEASSSSFSKKKDENDMRRQSFPTESESQAAIAHSHSMLFQLHLQQQSNHKQQNVFPLSGQTQYPMQKAKELKFGDHNYAVSNENGKINSAPIQLKSRERGKEKKDKFDWDSLRIQAQAKAGKREKTENTMDSLDWDAVRCADVSEIADAIKERGMNNMLAERIKNFLNLLVDMHGAIDLEWLRDVPPDQAKEYLLSIRGLGLKSVECVRLLTLHHLAFPVDTNVGRIAVRLGWVPLQPLPESLQLHLLELYPVLESIQKYLWPRLCKLDQRTLYELHYQLITFGKVFCTKSKPNCNACPMRGECRHFASAFASARLALPGPEQGSAVITAGNNQTYQEPSVIINQLPLPLPENTKQVEELKQREASRQLEAKSEINIYQPIIEEPATPEPECSQVSENDIEDAVYEESCEIPTIKLDIEEFTLNLQNYMQENMELQEGEMSKALVALNPEAPCIPMPKLKNVSRLRTEHCVYELPDSHPLLEGWDNRELDDPGKYLLAIWTPGETANSIQPPERKCSSQDCGQLCSEKECLSCNGFREANSQIVRGTLLIPCRTAMRGSFPLNGTYFQVNEVFADHDSSINPISVPRSWIWNLNRRTVYFGTSIPTIFKGLSTLEIQQCFWRGYVCVRGFDRETRAPRPLMARLHYPASKLTKNKDNNIKKGSTSANSQGLNLDSNPEQPELLFSAQNLQERGGA